MATAKKFELSTTPAWVLTLQDLSGYTAIRQAILAETAERTADDFVPPYVCSNSKSERIFSNF